MEKDLNEADNIVLNGIAKKLKKANKDLDDLLLHFHGEIEAGHIETRRLYHFEPSMKLANSAIARFEQFVIEHPFAKFDHKIIEGFEYQKELYEFRKELLKDVFKEAYKKSSQIK